MCPESKNEECFLTKEGLKAKLQLKSTRGVDELVKRRRIPCVRLGHKTLRFSWPSVARALEKLTINAVETSKKHNQRGQ